MVVEVALGIRLEPVFATAGLSFALVQPVGDGVCWVLVALEGDDAGGVVDGCVGALLLVGVVFGALMLVGVVVGVLLQVDGVVGALLLVASVAAVVVLTVRGEEKPGLVWLGGDVVDGSLTAHPRPSNGGLLAYELGWGLLATKLALAWLVRCFRYALSSVLLNFVRVLLSTNF